MVYTKEIFRKALPTAVYPERRVVTLVETEMFIKQDVLLCDSAILLTRQRPHGLLRLDNYSSQFGYNINKKERK
jgi:hypothetical protein